MKKIFAFALAASAIFGVQAQDAKTLFDQAKKLDDQFNKSKPTAAAPNREVTPEAAKALVDAVVIYNQVLDLDKNEAKPKFTKKIQDNLKKHAAAKDFYNAALVFYNNQMGYPDAYNAFMLSGLYSKEYQTEVDTVYALDFYNAGNLAYGTDFAAAAKAYKAACESNVPEVKAYVYYIGSLQQLAQQDPSYAEQSKQDIFNVSKQAIERFGAGEDFILSNYLQYYIDQEKFDEALNLLSSLEAADPTNANLYRLRGIINNANRKYADAIPAFEKMAELSDNYNYLNKAADDLNRIGKMVMGNLGNTVTPEQKAEVLHIFNSALNIAKQAKTIAEANPERPSDINNAQNLIEQIEYSVENANRL